MVERFFDIFLSGFTLLVLSPLLLPTVLVLRFTGEGEICFLQERIGKNGEVFKLFKFATMLKNSPNIGTRTVTMSSDPRVLPVGKFLRKTKINELMIGRNNISWSNEIPGYSGQKGDIVFNMNPTSSNCIGWQCLGKFKWRVID